MKKNIKHLVVAFVLGLVLVQGTAVKNVPAKNVAANNGDYGISTLASIDVPFWL